MVSNVLDGSSDKDEADGDAEDEFNQDATNMGTVNPNQEQEEGLQALAESIKSVYYQAYKIAYSSSCRAIT
jgi:hypothetical protein